MGNFAENTFGLRASLRDYSILELVTRIHAESLHSQQPIIVVAARLFEDLLPGSLRRRLSLWRQMQRHVDAGQSIDIRSVYGLTKSFSAAARIERGIDISAAGMTLNRSSQLAEALSHYISRRLLQSPDTAPSTSWTYPYTHRPLVQFSLSVPPHIMCTSGQRRILMRNAFQGFVPPAILARRSKGYAAPFVFRALRSDASEFVYRVHGLHVVERGYIDQDWLRNRLHSVIQGSTTVLGNLVKIVALERWFEARAGRLEPFPKN
jgi:hypothetical protein